VHLTSQIIASKYKCLSYDNIMLTSGFLSAFKVFDIDVQSKSVAIALLVDIDNHTKRRK